MNTTTKPDAAAEPRPLEQHELEPVSGGALISAAQLKTDNANQEALGGASKQSGSQR